MARTTGDTAAPTRTRKTPAEKAQAALAKAQKDVDKATDRATKLRASIEEAEADQARAQRYLTFAQANPDLPQENAESDEQRQAGASLAADAG